MGKVLVYSAALGPKGKFTYTRQYMVKLKSMNEKRDRMIIKVIENNLNITTGVIKLIFYLFGASLKLCDYGIFLGNNEF